MRRRSSAKDCNQADLLKGRGELCNAKLVFQAELPDTSSVHLRARGLDRLGFRLKHSASQQVGLSVNKVSDKYRARDTPVVDYNIRQERQRRSLYKINPGDRIRSVNSCEAFDGMVEALNRASDQEQGLQLCLERELQDVLQPQGAPEESSEKALGQTALCSRRWEEAVASPRRMHSQSSFFQDFTRDRAKTLRTFSLARANQDL
mmetsp:Transcript_91105/g.162155  ORF Transcript_91105/g.162155 Transcript_91105/m.162155 type:complete len:205 (+) Transcript_91105:37-651(+)